MSSALDGAEHFLEAAGFDRGPWLAVALVGGIAAWFALPGPLAWVIALSGALAVALGALAAWRGNDSRARLQQAAVVLALVFAAGLALVWLRSGLIGTAAIERPLSGTFQGRILERIEQPAEDRVRLVLAMREPETGRAIKVRVNVPLEHVIRGLGEGALIRFQARLMPPAPPMLPGSYNFARAAWFEGLAATGSLQRPPQVMEPAGRPPLLASTQRSLADHVRSQVPGSAGAIAAAFASGDRGSISPADEEAMRDSGLTHLLSISGLHVSAVIAAAFFVALKVLALWPWLALRVRLPVVAAGMGALAGIGYTLLTGGEVPTLRSCLAALLVLGALAMGREALSMRMVAVAACVVLVLWPEALAGPSFQMSFAAVIAIVALHEAQPVRDFLAPREESWLARGGRRGVMLLVTGLVIEVALMPIVLFHFHRAGVYGALANVVAIPLVTFIAMPMIALALLADLVGAGAPFWWLTGKALDLLLWIAHFTAGQPGAVKLMPQMTHTAFALFLAGGLWLGLWHGRRRLLGLLPVGVATGLLLATPVPDVLVSGDGRHVGITGEGAELLVLRESRSDYTRENMLELAGVAGEPVPLADWPGAECSTDFCVITLRRGGRDWHLLMSRSRSRIEERALAAACERADIVVSERWLPRSCRPRWLKADGRYLEENGGLAIILDGAELRSVAQTERQHPWWQVTDRS
ncbi:ComEC/Rec2 family competence protein [Alteraurantiacibacter buctensis]|uniref:ComEC/Rec2 family competence protein n=1 Tax=Alteraurantiacibacter buctensis TaxID=1503981 RepID=UPI00301E1D0E